MMKRWLILLPMLLLSILLIGCGETSAPTVFSSSGDTWHIGFSSAEIAVPEDSESPLYIAGYQSGAVIDGILDLQRANAVWLGTDADTGILLIGIDCIGLGSDTVDRIRGELSDFCTASGCKAIAVYATHTHAGLDTLGLWGPYAQNGKNSDFMDNMITSAVQAAKDAYANRQTGALTYSQTEAENMQYDSRYPLVYDETMHQLRFIPDDGGAGVRMVFFAAHAESLRGDNLLLSRDFPGAMGDIIKEQTGDDFLFIPGAIGGLIMTPVMLDEGVPVKDAAYYTENCRYTGELLARMLLTIPEHTEIPVVPTLSYAETAFDVPLDNTAFLLMKFLGILGQPSTRGSDSETGYELTSRCAALRFGDSITAALLPGEIFPELVYEDREFSEAGPDYTLTGGTFPSLSRIAEKYNCGTLLIGGLCNDELGYILPPDDYLVHPTLPYFERIEDDTGENHYEETNSAGIRTAQILFAAMEEVFAALAAAE